MDVALATVLVHVFVCVCTHTHTKCPLPLQSFLQSTLKLEFPAVGLMTCGSVSVHVCVHKIRRTRRRDNVNFADTL